MSDTILYIFVSATVSFFIGSEWPVYCPWSRTAHRAVVNFQFCSLNPMHTWPQLTVQQLNIVLILNWNGIKIGIEGSEGNAWTCLEDKLFNPCLEDTLFNMTLCTVYSHLVGVEVKVDESQPIQERRILKHVYTHRGKHVVIMSNFLISEKRFWNFWNYLHFTEFNWNVLYLLCITKIYSVKMYWNTLTCIVQLCTVLIRVAFHCIVFPTLYCTALHYFVLHCIEISFTVLYWVALYCNVLYSTVYYCIVLSCIVMYSTVWLCESSYCTAF